VTKLSLSKSVKRSAVNFFNILRTNFSYEYDVSAAFPNYMYVEKAAKTMFVQKSRAYNVDEIDTCSELISRSVDEIDTCSELISRSNCAKQ